MTNATTVKTKADKAKTKSKLFGFYSFLATVAIACGAVYHIDTVMKYEEKIAELQAVTPANYAQTCFKAPIEKAFNVVKSVF